MLLLLTSQAFATIKKVTWSRVLILFLHPPPQYFTGFKIYISSFSICKLQRLTSLLHAQKKQAFSTKVFLLYFRFWWYLSQRGWNSNTCNQCQNWCNKERWLEGLVCRCCRGHFSVVMEVNLFVVRMWKSTHYGEAEAIYLRIARKWKRFRELNGLLFARYRLSKINKECM